MNFPPRSSYLSFKDENASYEFALIKDLDRDKYLVDVFVYEKDKPGAAWIHDIVDGRVIWISNKIINISPAAKNYISRVLKLKAFI